MGNRHANRSRRESGDLKLNENEMKLLEKSTHFNREQILDFYQSFMSDCPNGELNKKDFNKMFTELQPSLKDLDKGNKYCEYVFNAFDASSSGYISFSEFLIAMSVTSFGDIQEKTELAFKILDLNKDNKVDRHEMLKVFTCLYDITGVPSGERKGDAAPKARVDMIMQKLDKDGDSYLSFDEFIDGALNDESIHKILVDPLFYCKIDF